MKSNLLEYSFQNNLSHIPSALSMLDYLDFLFTNKIIVPFRDKIVIGKPFGAQAYYLIWHKLGYLKNIEKLSVGVKHDEIDFVDYSEETMGNSLGVAAGIAMTTENRVWVNLSDATLQMGNALEAIQFIGQRNLKNILVTIDYNNAQVTGKVNDILTVDPVIQFFKNYNWTLTEINGHKIDELKKINYNLRNTTPNVIICHTRKGCGFKKMEDDIRTWHYKKIESELELKMLLDETNEHL